MSVHPIRSDTATFDQFWSMYPRRVAKQAALKAWAKLSEADRTAAIEALPVHRKQWSDPTYIPHPATWLNGRRFEDELDVTIQVEPCHWKGCAKPGTQPNGKGWYCERHVMAIRRGETA